MDTRSQIILGFDMDGVIIDHSVLKIDLLEKLGHQISLADTPSDILKRIIPEDVQSILDEMLYHNRETALEAPIMAGVEDALIEIKRRGLPYVLISRRKKPEVAIELLSARGFWPVYFDDKNTFFVDDAEAKHALAQKLNVTHYLDDQPSVLETLSLVSNRFLLDPLNVYADTSTYRRINSWEEFMNNVIST
ncbi:hypothetical protein HY967_02185 [Candidatus Jorgensenbacteria bacterium]|nr:hypothetical protein [Candidatus Jorgensenbacteria bacterium]